MTRRKRTRLPDPAAVMVEASSAGPAEAVEVVEPKREPPPPRGPGARDVLGVWWTYQRGVPLPRPDPDDTVAVERLRRQREWEEERAGIPWQHRCPTVGDGRWL